MAVNPWMTVGVLSGSNGDPNFTPFLKSLSSAMSPLVQTDGSGGGAGGTYAQMVAGQTSDNAGDPQAADQRPLFPTKTTKTNKNYKDPRTASPGWIGGSNLFDDDSHGANVMGQLAARGAPPSGGGESGGDGGHHGGGHGGHHGGHGGHGDYGGGFPHLGPIGRAIAGRFGRWW